MTNTFMIREFEFLCPAQVTLVTERRENSPYGLRGGADGKRGKNILLKKNKKGILKRKKLPSKIELTVSAGDRICLYTPGGGGLGFFRLK